MAAQTDRGQTKEGAHLFNMALSADTTHGFHQVQHARPTLLFGALYSTAINSIINKVQ